MDTVLVEAKSQEGLKAKFGRVRRWVKEPQGNLWLMSLTVMAVFWCALASIAALVALEQLNAETEIADIAARSMAEHLASQRVTANSCATSESTCVAAFAAYSHSRVIAGRGLEVALTKGPNDHVMTANSARFVEDAPLPLQSSSIGDRVVRVRVALPEPSWAIVVDKHAPLLGATHGLLLAAIGVAFTIFKSQLTLARVRRLREQQDLIDGLRRGQEREHQANAMKSKFIATISHELRTPLNSILGFSELIQLNPESPQNARFGELIHESGRHLLNLVNALLDMAKIEAGRMELDLERFDALRVASNVTDLHRASANAKGLDVEFLGGPSQQVWLQSDLTKFTQILNNLLSNAVKFTDAGSVTVRCSQNEDSFMLTVGDTGRGIEPDRLDGVFARFTSHISAKDEGTGLGLALSRELAQFLGGTLTIESAPGQGTTATLAIPKACVACPGGDPSPLEAGVEASWKQETSPPGLD